MKKKIFSLFLAVILILSLAACGTPDGSTDVNSDSSTVSSSLSASTGNSSDVGGSTDSVSSESSTQSSTQSSTESSTQSSTQSSSNTSPVVPTEPLYDASIEHKVILTDNSARKIVILDLNVAKEDWKKLDWRKSSNSAVRVWESKILTDFCGVKYRELPTGEKYVLATSSYGSAYVIDYETKNTVATLTNYPSQPSVEGSLYNAHSIEMLPNGDIIVACSGYQVDNTSYNYQNGGLRYFKRIVDGTKVSYEYKSSLTLPFAHAALWDPSENCLWSIGFEGVVAVDVNTATCTMTKNAAKSLSKVNFTGHDMVPAFGREGCFWISDNSSIYLFDAVAKKLHRTFTYTSKGIKGMAYFEDGTMVTSDWSNSLRIYVNKPANNKDGYKLQTSKVEISGSGTQIYKIHTCTPRYE